MSKDDKHYRILAITTAYESGVGKGWQTARGVKGIKNPWADDEYGCRIAWDMGHAEGLEQARNKSMTEAPADTLVGVGTVRFVPGRREPKVEWNLGVNITRDQPVYMRIKP